MAKKTPGRNRPLAYPIKLLDGSTIATMKDAVLLITKRLPPHRQSKEVWLHAAELLLKAQRTGKTRDLEQATDQVCRALVVEGWIA